MQLCDAPRVRTSGIDLPYHDMEVVLRAHITLADAAPRTLWQWNEKNGWQSVDAHRGILEAVLKACSGRIPKFVSFHASVRRFLTDMSLNWSLGDTERATIDLRKALSLLLKIRREKPPAVPRKYSHLQYLVDLVYHDRDPSKLAAKPVHVAVPPAEPVHAAVPPDEPLDQVLFDEPNPRNLSLELCAHVDHPPSEVLEVSSVSDDDPMVAADTFESLESQCFDRRLRIRSKSPAAASSAKAMAASEVDALLVDALETEKAAPLPSDYRKAFPKGDGKKRKKEEGGQDEESQDQESQDQESR